QAAALVITVPDQDAAIRASAIARGLNPSLFIAARTSIVSSGLLARQAGADHVTIDELATAESMQHAVLDRLLPIVAAGK
ncbi:MAG: NAD-binding protein, partial [Phycisphaeraceae bacterium]|nr:NAD-binding protein [Phycisphaeraceae bacterium]